MALDVARILLRPTEELATTDIASYALTALEESSIRSCPIIWKLPCKSIHGLTNFMNLMI